MKVDANCPRDPAARFPLRSLPSNITTKKFNPLPFTKKAKVNCNSAIEEPSKEAKVVSGIMNQKVLATTNPKKQDANCQDGISLAGTLSFLINPLIKPSSSCQSMTHFLPPIPIHVQKKGVSTVIAAAGYSKIIMLYRFVSFFVCFFFLFPLIFMIWSSEISAINHSTQIFSIIRALIAC